MKNGFSIMLSCLLTAALLLSIGSQAFADTLVLPPSLTAIGAEAFRGDTSLDEVVIPDGVTEIPQGAFAESSLRSVHIPASVTSIAGDAFYGADPVYYLADLNAFGGNLDDRGIVHLTQDTVISSPVSFNRSTLIIDAGVTLTVNAPLQGNCLIINGTVINCGSVIVTGSVSTGGAGVLSIDSGAYTGLPAGSFLRIVKSDSTQINRSESGGCQPLMSVSRLETSVDIHLQENPVKFCFIPDRSGSYNLTSTSFEDTYVFLYDADNQQLDHDDDSGENLNFSVTHDLSADTVYYFSIWYVNKSSTGSITYSRYSTGTIPLVLSFKDHGAEITSQPTSVKTEPNETVSFQVTAAGSGLTYRWQTKLPGSNTWENASFNGSDTPTLSLDALQSDHGRQFRCIVTGSDGVAVCSDAASLYVTAATAQYRALLISEVNFPNDICNRNEGDVQIMRALLENVKSPTGDSYSITTGKDLSPAQIQAAIQNTFCDATSQDVSLFFIATHGNTTAGAGSSNAGALSTVSGTPVLFENLAAWLSAVPGKVIVIVESCGSGASIYASGLLSSPPVVSDEAFSQALIDAFARLDENVSEYRSNTGELRVNNKFYVLTAAALQQRSWGTERESFPHNYFTVWLAGGVGTSGLIPADVSYGNSDGFAALEELYRYISAMGDDRPFTNNNVTYYQTVKRYPENSDYQLFMR